jgi:hypothetical protein
VNNPGQADFFRAAGFCRTARGGLVRPPKLDSPAVRRLVGLTPVVSGVIPMSIADPTALLERYPRAVVGKFDSQSEAIMEMDALVAYLQMLGTLVRFSDLPPERLRQ